MEISEFWKKESALWVEEEALIKELISHHFQFRRVLKGSNEGGDGIAVQDVRQQGKRFITEAVPGREGKGV